MNNRNDILLSRIRMRRKALGLTQRQFADAADLAYGTYTKYEEGTMPGIEQLKKLALFLDVSMDYLVGLTDEPGPTPPPLPDPAQEDRK